MFRHRFVLTLVAILALGGLLASACGDADESPTTAPAAPAAEPAPAPEPATAPPEAPEPDPEPAPTPPEPPEPAPAPPEPPEDEPPPDTTAEEEPPPPTSAEEPPEDTEDESPADDGATGGAEAADAPSFPVTITSDAGTWTLESQPHRIVSLSPSATEILFAIGAGPQVVAVDNWSTYPPEAPTTDLSGFDPNIEAITAYEPDLVVISNDSNDLVAGLTALDIPVLISPSPFDIEGGYASVETLGLATGHAAGAAEVSETMRSEIAAALADAPVVPIRIYHELDDTHFSVSSHSFLGAVYATLGTTNIADPADADGYGYPQLTEEYIIEADPELIIITDLLAYSAADVAARPGWDTVTAVRDGNILVVNADIASRWGPRLPQFVTAIVEALAAIAAES
ncbi:MAG: ABC transporter substrate-binding protein [bacterium]|nr:ABC transporter substrate-binding protein [bacterium]